MKTAMLTAIAALTISCGFAQTQGLAKIPSDFEAADGNYDLLFNNGVLHKSINSCSSDAGSSNHSDYWVNGVDNAYENMTFVSDQMDSNIMHPSAHYESLLTTADTADGSYSWCNDAASCPFTSPDLPDALPVCFTTQSNSYIEARARTYAKEQPNQVAAVIRGIPSRDFSGTYTFIYRSGVTGDYTYATLLQAQDQSGNVVWGRGVYPDLTIGSALGNIKLTFSPAGRLIKINDVAPMVSKSFSAGLSRVWTRHASTDKRRHGTLNIK